MNKKIVLTLDKVSKSFTKIDSDDLTHALNDVSVSMTSGEFVSLVGPSGCGKSTILRLVAGLINPTVGTVAVDGKVIEKPAPDRGFVFQNSSLFPDEPLGALDAFTRMNMQDEILKIWERRHQLAIMVTHDVDEAIYMGTRVLVMDAGPGRIVADIKIKEDYPRDRSSDVFFAYRNEILRTLHFSSGGSEAESIA